jgi:hypothetical protein
MSLKSTTRYNEVFKKLKELTPEKRVTHHIAYFEITVSHTAKEHSSNIKISCFYFHFCQSLFKKFTVVGSKKEYNENMEVRMFLSV